jgi:hypothetical protein
MQRSEGFTAGSPQVGRIGQRQAGLIIQFRYDRVELRIPPPDLRKMSRHHLTRRQLPGTQ